MANRTADTPGVSESELARMRIDELRDHARSCGISGAVRRPLDQMAAGPPSPVPGARQRLEPAGISRASTTT